MVLPLTYIEISRDIPSWVVALVFFIPLVGGLILYFYKTRHSRTWRKGIFPLSLKFTQDNLLEAYLALGSLLILLDYNQTKGKVQFINQYFNRYFKEENYNFGDSLLFSMKHPLKIDTACEWLNKHLKEEGERAQVIYFLTGLAFLNESLSKKELQFLQIMNEKLNLEENNLRRIISIFQSYKDARRNSEQKKTDRKSPSIEQRYREILNIEPNADLQTIKSAYRTLAKKHHPDVFTNASEAQKRIAEEKFGQIQEAYEYLSNKQKGHPKG